MNAFPHCRKSVQLLSQTGFSMTLLKHFKNVYYKVCALCLVMQFKFLCLSFYVRTKVTEIELVRLENKLDY